jgi:hypothetical protein
MPKWRNEYRRCDNCRREYRPQREAQSYCSPNCRRAAAYGRERFKAGTKGRRQRRLEASDKLIGILVAGSFRNGDFSSIKTGCCRPANWIEKLNQRDASGIDQAYWTREKRKWPVDLMGGHRHGAKQSTFTLDHKLRKTILDTERVLEDHGLVGEALKGEDVSLEFHEDGYPRLPDSLDRRTKPLLAQAA